MKRWKKIWSIPGKDGEFLGWPAVVFIIVQLVIGCPLLPYVLLHWQSADSLRFACFMAVCLGAPLFQCRPARVQAATSSHFPFLLLRHFRRFFPQTLLIGLLRGVLRAFGSRHVPASLL